MGRERTKEFFKTKKEIIKEIKIVWSIEDVLSRRSDLTEEQASKVLVELENSHNAEIGINWEVIDTTAEILYPDKNKKRRC